MDVDFNFLLISIMKIGCLVIIKYVYLCVIYMFCNVFISCIKCKTVRIAWNSVNKKDDQFLFSSTYTRNIR